MEFAWIALIALSALVAWMAHNYIRNSSAAKHMISDSVRVVASLAAYKVPLARAGAPDEYFERLQIIQENWGIAGQAAARKNFRVLGEYLFLVQQFDEFVTDANKYLSDWESDRVA